MTHFNKQLALTPIDPLARLNPEERAQARDLLTSLLTMGLTFLVTFGTGEGLKTMFSEERPGVSDATYQGTSPNKAFPSGHTLEVVSLGLCSLYLLTMLSNSKSFEGVRPALKKSLETLRDGLKKYATYTPLVAMITGALRISASAHFLKNVLFSVGAANDIFDLVKMNRDTVNLANGQPRTEMENPFGDSPLKFAAMSLMLGLVDGDQRGVSVGLALTFLFLYLVSLMI